MAAPKLRFKAFIKPYKNIKYEEFAPLQRGFDLPVSTIVDGEYPVVFSNGILKKHNSFKAKAPGVVTGRSGTIGNITWVDKDYWPHNTSLWVTNFFDNDPRYIFYFLQDFDVSRFASGSGVPTLNRNDVHAQLIHIPTDRNEQSKIASFLSAVDEKISQLTQKHQLLSQYKQGMMKKLFSQQIRFKADDGSEFGEWEEKTIGEIGEVVTGKTPSTTNSNAWNGNVLFVTPTDMKGNKYQNTTIRTVANKQPKVLPQNTIMFTCIASIGKMALSVKPSITNQQINSIIVKNDHPEFIYYQLLNMVDYIKSTQANTTLPIINKTEFSKFFLRIPQQAEQTKIANFLSTIDQKIEVVTQQIEQAKQWKKGLLQQMFV